MTTARRSSETWRDVMGGGGRMLYIMVPNVGRTLAGDKVANLLCERVRGGVGIAYVRCVRACACSSFQ